MFETTCPQKYSSPSGQLVFLHVAEALCLLDVCFRSACEEVLFTSVLTQGHVSVHLHECMLNASYVAGSVLYHGTRVVAGLGDNV